MKNETQTTLTIAMSRDLPPLSFLNATGQPAGIFEDIWRLWAEKTGRKIAFRLMPWAETIKGLKQGEADIHAGLFEAENRAGWIRFSRPIYGVGIRAYFPVKKGIISSIQELAGQKVGVTQGSHIESYVRDRYPEVNVAALRSTEEAVYAAREGTIAAFVGVDPVVSAILTRLGLQGEFESTPEPLYTRTFRAGVLKENTELAPVIDKGLDNISIDELARIEARWIPDRDKRYYKPAEKRIRLTTAERAWLRAHPDIELGYTDAFEPEVIVNPDGSHSGILVDFLEALNKRLGTRITLRIDSIPGILQKAKTKEVDGILEMHPEYADKLGLLKSIGYLRAYPAVFARKDVSFAGPDDFAGKKIAIIDKVYFTEKMVREYGQQATILRVKDAIQGIKSVSEGGADLYIGVSFNSYYITKYQLFDVVTKYIFYDFTDKFGIAVRPDWPELVPILNKGIASFSQNEIDTIVTKWIHLPQQEKTVELTSEERAWLREHPIIRLGIDQSWEPFVFVVDGVPVKGVDVELLKRINELTGCDIQLVTGKWKELVEQAKRRDIDGLAESAATDERKEWFVFSDSYLSHYYALITTPDNKKWIDKPSDLIGKRVSIQAGNLWLRKIVESIRDVQIVEATTQAGSFGLVVEGKADAACVGMGIGNKLQRDFQPTSAVIAHVFHDHRLDIVYSIRKDWPEMAGILNKALAAITDDEKAQLLKKYSLNLPEESEPVVDLTPEEQAWLREHPIITLGGGNFPPLDFFDKIKGQSDGVGPDYAKLIGSMLGVKFKLVSGEWKDILNRAKSKKIDGVRLIYKTEEREKYLNFTKPYIKIAHAIVRKKSTEGLSSLKDLSHKRVGMLQGIFAYHYLAEHYPDIELVAYPTWEKALRALVENDLDAIVGTLPATTYMIDKLFITNLKVAALPPEMERKVRLGIRPDWPELTGILNKAIDSITIKQHSEIKRKWIALFSKDNKRAISITPEEQAWLNQNHTVQVRVVNIPPYSILKKDAAPTGISIDYLKLISERSGVKFNYVASGKTFPEALAGLKSHQGPDLVPLITQTPERAQSILFSKDYLRSPFVIFSHAGDKEFISDMNDLRGKKIALPRGQLVHERIKSEYPELNLVLFDNDAQAIDAVATRQAEAYIGNLTLASYLIPVRGLVDLKIAGASPFGDQEFSMGMRNDWPELASIINKSLASISPEERVNIRNKYLSIKYEHTETAVIIKWIFIIGGAASGIVLLLFFWNRSLAKIVQERTYKLSESEERFRSTFEQAAVGIAHVSLEGRFLRINKKFCDIVGYTHDKMLSITFQDITHPDDLDSDLKHVSQLLAEEAETYIIEKRYIRKNGEIVWVNLTVSLLREETGTPRYFISAVEDITDRKQVEEALLVSEEKFRNLMEQSPFSIQIIKPDGRIEKINKAFMKLWGISEETLPEVLEKYNVLEDEEARKLGIIPFIEKACRGEAVILPEIEYDASKTMENLDIVGTESKKLWIQARLYPVKNNKGEVTNVVFIEEDITDRKQAEKKINNYQERLKALASQLTITEEKERRRIAADLHDQIGQSLALARIQMAAAKKSAADDGLAAKLDDISEILREAVQDTRHLIFDLSPPAMHEIGLGAAISEWLDDQIGNRYGLKTEFFDNIDQSYRKTLDESVRAILFRNVRELLINVVKHAQANQVSVSTEITDGVLKIVVQDDGIGFDHSSEIQSMKSDGGFGLFSIKERMADLGGTLEIESEPGKGCRAILSLPLDRGLASGS